MRIFKHILNSKSLPGNHTREKGVFMDDLYITLRKTKNKKTPESTYTDSVQS